MVHPSPNSAYASGGSATSAGSSSRASVDTGWHAGLRFNRPPPLNARQDSFGHYPLLVADDGGQHRLHQLLGEEVRLQAQIQKSRVLGVVVVLLRLHSGILDRLDLDTEAQLDARSGDRLGQLQHGELLGELVEHPELAGRGRILGGEIDTLQRVSDIEVSARLPAPPVNRQWLIDDSLDAETVKRRTEALVVVKAGEQPLVVRGFLGVYAIHHALVEIRRAEAPHATREMDVVAVVHLREVIERARLLRKRHDIGSAVVADFDEALFNVDVGCAVLAHGAEFDEVAIGREIAHREQHVQRASHVVRLGENGVIAIDHRVRRAGLFPVMNQRLWLELSNHTLDKGVIGDVADVRLYAPAGHFTPGLEPFVQRPNGCEAVASELQVITAPREVVQGCHPVAPGREVQCSWPAKVAIAAQNEYAHSSPSIQMS